MGLSLRIIPHSWKMEIFYRNRKRRSIKLVLKIKPLTDIENSKSNELVLDSEL